MTGDSIIEEADVAVEAHFAVDKAVVVGLIDHLAAIGIDGMLEAVALLIKLLLCLLLVAAVIDVAHRAVLGLIFKNHPKPHLSCNYKYRKQSKLKAIPNR